MPAVLRFIRWLSVPNRGRRFVRWLSVSNRELCVGCGELSNMLAFLSLLTDELDSQSESCWSAMSELSESCQPLYSDSDLKVLMAGAIPKTMKQ